MDMNQKTKAFRETIQASRRFRLTGKWHLVANLSFALMVSLTSFTSMETYSPTMFFLIPVIFLVGSLVEYCGHRWLLHIHRSFFTTPYREHTLSHHFYFTHEALHVEQEVDLHFVLFNLTGLIFFVLLIGGVFAFSISLLLGRNAGLFFMGLCGLYFLTYEVLHTIYHLPEGHTVFRLRLLRELRDHHRRHHDQSRMNERNFGIITDIWDRLLKTKI